MPNARVQSVGTDDKITSLRFANAWHETLEDQFYISRLRWAWKLNSSTLALECDQQSSAEWRWEAKTKFINILQQWILWLRVWLAQMWTLRWQHWLPKILLNKTLMPTMKWSTFKTGTHVILNLVFLICCRSFLCNEVCFIVYISGGNQVDEWHPYFNFQQISSR